MEKTTKLAKKIKRTPEELAAWRLKKAEKRDKQRAANLKRAKDMHKLWIANKAVSTMPCTDLLDNKQYYIGCSGWFYWHWRGRFYPTEMSTSEWFKHYCKSFATVELNAPFYSWPSINTVKTWRKLAEKNHCIYTVKVPELITHIKKFSGTKQLILDLDIIAYELGPYFGCFLFQLPPSYKYTKTRLHRILNNLNRNRRNVVEFRHISWWNEEVFTAFKKEKIMFCSTSSPKFPDDCVKTAEEIYIRFHGKDKWYRHNYSKEELSSWVEKIIHTRAKRVWAYFNNDNDAYAINNAKEFQRQLKRKINKKPKSF
jgi:uncharacterized protein YecE (DUF72 family)